MIRLRSAQRGRGAEPPGVDPVREGLNTEFTQRNLLGQAVLATFQSLLWVSQSRWADGEGGGSALGCWPPPTRDFCVCWPLTQRFQFDTTAR